MNTTEGQVALHIPVSEMVEDAKRCLKHLAYRAGMDISPALGFEALSNHLGYPPLVAAAAVLDRFKPRSRREFDLSLLIKSDMLNRIVHDALEGHTIILPPRHRRGRSLPAADKGRPGNNRKEIKA